MARNDYRNGFSRNINIIRYNMRVFEDYYFELKKKLSYKETIVSLLDECYKKH